MKRKKLLSLILALAMAFSLAIPAFAEGGDGGGGGGGGGNTAAGTTQNVAITGSTQSGVINITVAATGAILLNPYQLKATVNSVVSYHQIYHKAVACENKSTFALSVDATVVGTPTTGVTLVNAAPALTVTDKQVFLYAEFGVNESATVEPTWQTAYNAKNANQVLVAATPGTEKTGVASLPATNGTTANYLWYKFDGAATKKPGTAWTTDDKVDATIALTLNSVVSDVYAITVTNTQTATAKGTATLNLDVAPAGESITLTCAADSTTASAKPTVTIKGVAATDITENASAGTWTFPMPAAAVTITVKWA